MERLFTCREVAKRYGVSRETVWRWIRTKRLCAVKVGTRNYRVRGEDLEAFERTF